MSRRGAGAENIDQDRTAEGGPVRRQWWSVVPALVAMVATAVWRLDQHSLWVDEVFSLAATNDLELSLRSTKGTMAGYYVLLWVWTRVGSSTLWLRLFSTIGAVVAITLVAAIARRLQPRRVAWVAPLLLVGIPIFAWTATEARSYAWETALVAGCWWLIVRGVEAYERREARQARWWVALAIGCALGPMMHGLFILQVPGFVVVAFLKRDAWHAMMRRILPSVFTAVIPTFVMYLAGGSSMGAAWAYKLPERLGVLPRWFLGPDHWIAVVVGLAAIAGVAVCLEGAISSRSLLDRTQSLLPLLWGGLGLFSAIAVAQIAGPFAPYYMASSAAGIALLIVQPLAWLHGTTIDARTGRRALGVAALSVILGVAARVSVFS